MLGGSNDNFNSVFSRTHFFLFRIPSHFFFFLEAEPQFCVSKFHNESNTLLIKYVSVSTSKNWFYSLEQITWLIKLIETFIHSAGCLSIVNGIYQSIFHSVTYTNIYLASTFSQGLTWVKGKKRSKIYISASKVFKCTQGACCVSGQSQQQCGEHYK